jgi:hypothetical protein
VRRCKSQTMRTTGFFTTGTKQRIDQEQ